MWRILLQNWLRSEAGEHARAAVYEAARNFAGGTPPAPQANAAEGPAAAATSAAPSTASSTGPTALGEPIAPDHADEPGESPPAPCDVGIVFALGIEAGGLLDLMQGVLKIRGADFVAYEGSLAGRRVVLIETGAGCANAARATEALIDGHQPAWVISAGFAGGLAPHLKRNDLFVPNSVASAAPPADSTPGNTPARSAEAQDPPPEHHAEQHPEPRDVRLAIDVKLPPGPNLHIGRLATVDHVARTPDEKRRLADLHVADAVDMETFAVAAMCRARKTRFFAVRVISDELNDELPPEIERLLQQETLSGRLGAAAGSIFRRPSSLKDMWKLKENAIVASDRLGKFLAELIAQLAPHP